MPSRPSAEKPAAKPSKATSATKAIKPVKSVKPAAVKVAFPKKAQPPSHAEFAARLAAPVGKRFEAVRTFLGKQGAREDFFYYGPKTGWAYRYQDGETSLCSLVILDGKLIGVLSLDAAAQARVRWDTLSDVIKRARRIAHGTPALLWLDVPLDGSGSTDFKALLKAKMNRASSDRG
jgi:hypothetical protein